MAATCLVNHPRKNVESQFIAVVDIGTTHIRCQIINGKSEIRGSSVKNVELLYPCSGYVELDPDELWESFVSVVKDAITGASLTANQISCIGIATQRGTFTTWNRRTGRPYHRFITWKDLRSDTLVDEWNKSWRMKLLKCGAKVLHSFTGQKRFLAASVLVFHSRQVLLRLAWALRNVPDLQRSAEAGNVAFGMIETWLLWKMTGGKIHATDYSCASATAMFDPFVMEWGEWALKLFNIPSSILPNIKDTSCLFGESDSHIFGSSIPITCLVGDQQAAMFGEGCFQLGDVKCTMGTGSFLDVNTGNAPHASIGGLYPLVGWKIGDETVYIAEGLSNDTGTAIGWLQQIGLLDNPNRCSDIANSVGSNGGLYFIPAFSGIQAPLNDNTACAGFLGISLNTSKEHMIRAVLESLAFRVKQMFDLMQNEANFDLSRIRVDGGVSNCDFILQLVADLTGRSVLRSTNIEMTCLGAAALAGLAIGVWKNKDELNALHRTWDTFTPRISHHDSGRYFCEWERAVTRCAHWYKDS